MFAFIVCFGLGLGDLLGTLGFVLNFWFDLLVLL